MSAPRKARETPAKPSPMLRPDRFVQSLREKSMSARFALLRFRAADMASQRSAATVAFASELRARADRELNSVLYLASGIVGYLVVRHDHLGPDEINRILGTVHVFGRHVRNFSIAVGHRISYMYPIEGNEQALDRDYREIPDQWPAVKAAIDSRAGVLTGPVSLVQGDSALICRIPIRLEGQYWGLLSTVIDMPSFEEAVFKGLDTARFEFAIRGDEQHRAGSDMFFGSPQLFSDPSAGCWPCAGRRETAPGRSPSSSSTWTASSRSGHKFGDAMLRKVAARIQEEMRLGDTVARWAGDEFAILLEDASASHAEQLS